MSKIIPECTGIFNRRQTFDFQQAVENVLNYLCFSYRLSRYTFLKKLGKLENCYQNA